MNSVEANIRNTNTKGEVNSLRINGNVPAVVYGGSEKNQKIYLSKKIEIISIAPMISEAMKRISNSTSVSSLFK